MAKKRVDQLLVDRGLAESRARAQALILAGEVSTDSARIDKPGQMLAEDCPLHVRARGRYVSRGGNKLEGALRIHRLSPRGLRCLDIGASTGGFTDCLLQHGAERVYAVDVGYGQLAPKLREDPRVVVMERTNARTLQPEALDGQVDLVVVDASFIGLGKLAEAIALCMKPHGKLLALIKPQFEVGAEAARRCEGVVRDPALRAQAIESALADLRAAGLSIDDVSDCVLPGPKGNLEAFVLASHGASTL